MGPLQVVGRVVQNRHGGTQEMFVSIVWSVRLDFRRLPALSGDECGLIFPNSGMVIEPTGR